MRALRRRCARGDDGVVLVWVAMSLTVLLGMGALVIDVGALYQERRQLQNGADAAALAVAKDCAEGNCLDEAETAQHFASENANDGASAVPLVCGEGPGLVTCPETPPEAAGAEGWVRVDTSTLAPGGGTQIDFVLAPFLDAAHVGRTVTASAIAAWGPAGRATTIPLIFSECEYIEAGGDVRADPPVFPDGEITIYLHSTTQAEHCDAGPAGGDLPGGFGWLDNDRCEVTVGADDSVGVDTGNDVPNGCDPARWRDAVVVIPIFDSVSGTGAGGLYHIAGFVGFHVTGYRFPGARWPSDFSCVEAAGGSGACIRGYFTEVTVPDGDWGPGTDFGARVIKMIG